MRRCAAQRADRLAAFESLVTRMSDDLPAREGAQLTLGRLRATAGYDLWCMAQPDAVETASWHVLFPVAGLSTVVASETLEPWNY